MAAEKKKAKKTPVKKTPAKKASVSKKTGSKKISPKLAASSSSRGGALPVLIILILLTVIVILMNSFYDKEGPGDWRKMLLTGDDVKDIREIKKKEAVKDKEKPAVEKKTESKRETEKKKPEVTMGREVQIYLLRLNEKTEKLYLSSVKRRISVGDNVGGALRSLVSGPTTYEKKRGFVSAVSSNITVRSVNMRGRTAEIDFSTAIEHGAAGDILLKRIKQIVFTATQFNDVDNIVIKINGRRRSSLGSDGFSISGPLRR